MTAPPRILVVAKAPVPGRVKTRLGADIGMARAADLAAAALLDTIGACTAAVGAQRCRLALDGDLEDAVASATLTEALAGWSVGGQRGVDLDERLVNAHLDLAAEGAGPVVQIGMDTPQATPDALLDVAAGLADAEAVLARATDGGWWALGLRDPADARHLRGVPMSRADTADETCRALAAGGLRVAEGPVLRDLDELEDAPSVLAGCGHESAFARAWRAGA